MKYCLALILIGNAYLGLAQLYLQEATIHPAMKRIGGNTIASIALSSDYIVIDEFAFSTGARVTDLNPDMDTFTPVAEDLTLGGYYVAKYDSTGKYLNHTTIQGGNKRTFAATSLSVPDGFYVLGNCKDSVQLGTLKSPFTQTNSESIYIVKYDYNLNLLQSTTWDRDSSEILTMVQLPNEELLLHIIYQGDYKLPFAGANQTIQKYRPSRTTQYHNVLVKLDKNFNYLKHYNFNKGGRSKNDLLMEYDSSSNSIVVGSEFGIDDSMEFNSSYIRKASTGPFTEFISLLLRFDLDLNPLNFLDLRLDQFKGLRTMKLSPDGNVLVQGLKDVTAGGVMLLLKNSNFDHLVKRQADPILSGSTVYQFKYGAGYNGKNFTLMHSGPSMKFPSGYANLNPIRLLELTTDSLNLVNNYSLNDFIEKPVYNDERGLMTSFSINGQQTLAPGYGNSPDFKLGSSLFPPKEAEGVQVWSNACQAPKIKLLYDTMSKCGDQYSDYRPVGKMEINGTGTGLTYQWYEAKDTTQVLLDTDPSFQGAYKRIGSQTKHLEVGSAITGYGIRRFRVKVGSTCSEAQWSDSVVQMLWGTPRLQLLGGLNTIYAKEGDSASITLFQVDEYPKDSFYLQWWLNDELITDGPQFRGTDSLKLYIDDITTDIAGAYECRPVRYHCKDLNTIDWGKIRLIVAVNSIEEAGKYGIKAFPNPTNNSFSIKTIAVPSKLEIFHANGQIIEEMDAYLSQNMTIDLANYNSGVYTCILHFDKNRVPIRIIKQ